jgi:hypothetical protein
MSNTYVIDACSLINIAHNYNMEKKSFSGIWVALEEKIGDGTLISSSEILDELKDKDLSDWAKKNKKAFIPLTQEIQSKTTDILKEYPQIIKMRSLKNSNGDPFLIATAIAFDGIVVSDEGTKSNGIPAICQKLNVDYINIDNPY